jgi:hypothetical protein
MGSHLESEYFAVRKRTHVPCISTWVIPRMDILMHDCLKADTLRTAFIEFTMCQTLIPVTSKGVQQMHLKDAHHALQITRRENWGKGLDLNTVTMAVALNSPNFEL